MATHASRTSSRAEVLRRWPAALVAIAALAAFPGCGQAGDAPGMDEIGEAMQRLGANLRTHGLALREQAARTTDAGDGPLRAAADRWIAEGDTLDAEGARIVRAADIVGLQTRGGRVPANSSRVVIFGVEAEADSMVSTAGRLAERGQALRTVATVLQTAGYLSAAEAQPLLGDAAALAVLAGKARQAGEAMRELARRYRRALGQRDSDDRVR